MVSISLRPFSRAFSRDGLIPREMDLRAIAPEDERHPRNEGMGRPSIAECTDRLSTRVSGTMRGPSIVAMAGMSSSPEGVMDTRGALIIVANRRLELLRRVGNHEVVIPARLRSSMRNRGTRPSRLPANSVHMCSITSELGERRRGWSARSASADSVPPRAASPRIGRDAQAASPRRARDEIELRRESPSSHGSKPLRVASRNGHEAVYAD